MQRSEESTRCPGTGVVGSCKLSDIGPGRRTQEKAARALTTDPPLQPHAGLAGIVQQVPSFMTDE